MGNVRWLVLLLIIIAVGAFLRPRPKPPLQAPPTPVPTPTAKAQQPELSYFERNSRKERFTFQVYGGSGTWKFRAKWVVRNRSIEDERGMDDGEVARIRGALEKVSEVMKRGRPLLESLHYEPHPVEVIEFSHPLAGGSCTPGNPKVWHLLHAELAPTLVAREQVMLRRELHARFNL